MEGGKGCQWVVPSEERALIGWCHLEECELPRVCEGELADSHRVLGPEQRPGVPGSLLVLRVPVQALEPSFPSLLAFDDVLECLFRHLQGPHSARVRYRR